MQMATQNFTAALQHVGGQVSEIMPRYVRAAMLTVAIDPATLSERLLQRFHAPTQQPRLVWIPMDHRIRLLPDDHHGRALWLQQPESDR